MHADALIPDWPSIRGVRAAVTTRRLPGRSITPYEHCNLGSRCGDDAAAVDANRASLIDLLDLPATPFWLRQVHGIRVIDDAARLAADVDAREPEADAAVSRSSGCVLAILTADCLPVLFATRDGAQIGIAHAGWRGLAAGVLEASLAQLATTLTNVQVWIGPAIGAVSYEVGEEVRAAFVDRDPGAAAAFESTRAGHWLCDLAGLARRRLQAAGLTQIYGGGFDTFTDARFYSYRRAPQTGRFASLIWRAPENPG